MSDIDLGTIDLSPKAVLGYLERYLGQADKVELELIMYEPGSARKLVVYWNAWYDRFRYRQEDLVRRMQSARIETREAAEQWVALEFLRMVREMRRGVVPPEALVH